jgi:hypothetical protein
MSDHNKLEALEVKTETHIVQCEERWKSNFNRLDNIDNNLQRIETRTITLGGAIILFLAGCIVTVLTTMG